jgi:hypothetical protein
VFNRRYRLSSLAAVPITLPRIFRRTVVRVHPSTYKAAPFSAYPKLRPEGTCSEGNERRPPRSPGKIEELTFVHRVSGTGLGERMALSIKSARLFPSQIIAYAMLLDYSCPQHRPFS